MKLFVGTIEENKACLTLEESHHVQKVLRMKLGDSLSVTDGNGLVVHGVISQVGKHVFVQIEQKIFVEKPTINLHIAIAPTKNIDRFEFFVEKATELGISTITPLLTQNSERKIINIDKLQKQAVAASKQSGRSYFPIIQPMTKLPDFMELHSEKPINICHCNNNLARKSIHEVKYNEEVLFLIGPEGDFSDNEIQQWNQLPNVSSISLGNSRLRTETAGIVVSSYFYGKSM